MPNFEKQPRSTVEKEPSGAEESSLRVETAEQQKSQEQRHREIEKKLREMGFNKVSPGNIEDFALFVLKRHLSEIETLEDFGKEEKQRLRDIDRLSEKQREKIERIIELAKKSREERKERE